MSITLHAKPRTCLRNSCTHELRDTGRIPAILYGKQIDSTPISIDEKKMIPILRDHPSALIDIEVEGGERRQAVISEVQKHPVSYKVIHVSFYQVQLTETVRAHVHLQLIGGPEQKEIRFQQHLTEVEVKCLPGDIPESISVDLSLLKYGKPIKVKDLRVGSGVRMLTSPSEVIIAPIH